MKYNASDSICIICGKKFLKHGRKSVHLGSRGIYIRPSIAKTCSKKCSLIYNHNR